LTFARSASEARPLLALRAKVKLARENVVLEGFRPSYKERRPIGFHTAASTSNEKNRTEPSHINKFKPTG
jgi:hypothetical protein